MKRIIYLLIIIAYFLSIKSFASAAKEVTKIKLISTTTTQISGLVPALLKLHSSKESRFEIHNIVLPSGLAIISAKHGLGDVLISHNPMLEDRLLAKSIKDTKEDLMYSYFAIVGPDRSNFNRFASMLEVLTYFEQQKVLFVSRSDNSGTYQMERLLWHKNGLDPDGFEGEWYLKIGANMSQTLNFAYEKDAYTLTDYPSYLAYKENHKTSKLIYYKPDIISKNQYSIYLLSPNSEYAQSLYSFLLSLEVEGFILNYKLAGQTPYKTSK